MTIKEALERAKKRPSYGEFSEEGKKSLATITTGIQVMFIRKDKKKPERSKDKKAKDGRG